MASSLILEIFRKLPKFSRGINSFDPRMNPDSNNLPILHKLFPNYALHNRDQKRNQSSTLNTISTLRQPLAHSDLRNNGSRHQNSYASVMGKYDWILNKIPTFNKNQMSLSLKHNDEDMEHVLQKYRRNNTEILANDGVCLHEELNISNMTFENDVVIPGVLGEEGQRAVISYTPPGTFNIRSVHGTIALIVQDVILIAGLKLKISPISYTTLRAGYRFEFNTKILDEKSFSVDIREGLMIIEGYTHGGSRSELVIVCPAVGKDDILHIRNKIIQTNKEGVVVLTFPVQ